MLVLLISLKCFAYDQDLANRLKEDLEHEANRRKAFKEFEEEKKRSEKEQNKGLSLWLEEQEQWDLSREKAVFQYKKDKRITPGEGSPEHLADLAEKERIQRKVEDGRKQHIAIKKQIIAQYLPGNTASEEEELGMYNQRPRYDLRKRGRNKWTKGGAVGSGSSGGGFNSGGGYQPPGDSFDFPPPPPADFNSIPTDNFDDFPPPPPPGDFGNAPGTFDSGFGDAPIPPPPPPPPEGGWDF